MLLIVFILTTAFVTVLNAYYSHSILNLSHFLSDIGYAYFDIYLLFMVLAGGVGVIVLHANSITSSLSFNAHR